jgi:RNA recognition motif-containing protein
VGQKVEIAASMNIYVGNLAFSTTEDELRTAFGAYGAVSSAAVIKDKATGQSRGFGFVEMPDSSEAKKAIEALNGAQLKGRTLTVNEARPREERTDNRSRGRGYGGGSGQRRSW